MMRTTLLFICMITISASSQNVKTVKGDYVYYGNSTNSIDDAKRTALENAKLQALADAFGTIVSETNEHHLYSDEGIDREHFFSLQNSDVRGEWIGDTKEPQYNISFKDETLVVSCHVEGNAREIQTSQVEFEAKILRNGVSDSDEEANFRHGDQICLSFQSPAFGYVACYLLEDDKAYCLLPYPDDKDGNTAIKANKRYIFFNKIDCGDEYDPNEIQEYILTCEGSMIVNHIYVLFSPNKFVKAKDKQSSNSNNGLELPREVPIEEFRTWLFKRRIRDPEFQVQKNTITIRPTK